MLCLLQKYDLVDPVSDNAAGVFDNNTLQELYNTLMEQGSQDLTGAMKAGAAIEDADIFDLMDLSANDVDNEDILAAFQELTKGSRNHLRAFMRQLNRLEEPYAPESISQELFDEIINSPRERGGQLCFTQGNGDCPNGNSGNGGNGNGNGGNGKDGEIKGDKTKRPEMAKITLHHVPQDGRKTEIHERQFL